MTRMKRMLLIASASLFSRFKVLGRVFGTKCIKSGHEEALVFDRRGIHCQLSNRNENQSQI
jgi:hypothetical protein